MKATWKLAKKEDLKYKFRVKEEFFTDFKEALSYCQKIGHALSEKDTWSEKVSVFHDGMPLGEMISRT